ncbi:MAG: protein O-mannosyl-transferase family [Planctomycetota bacterium]
MPRATPTSDEAAPADGPAAEIPSTPHRPTARALARLWTAVALAGCLLYGLTAQHGVSWQDSGLFQWRILTGDYVGNLGLALAHPLYIGMGRLAAYLPLGDFAWRINVLSGLGMALALANLAGLVTWLTRRPMAGLLAAGLLAVCHTVWWLATIAEAYTWVVAGLTAELWLLAALLKRPRWPLLAALALVSGLGWTLHNFALLPLPVYLAVAVVLVVRRRLPAWSLAAAAGGYLLGAAPYLVLIAGEAGESGLAPAIASALFGKYRGAVMNVSNPGRLFKANAALASMNFAGLLVPLAVVGWVKMRRWAGGATAAALGAIGLIELLFVVRYPVPDQFTFLLPTLTMLALGAGVGIAHLCSLSRRWRIGAVTACLISIAAQPAIYAAAPALARASGVGISRRRKLPFRDELRYWLVPWKHNEHSAERFARAALAEAQAAPDTLAGVIFASSTSAHPLRLTRELGDSSSGVVVQTDTGPLPPYGTSPGAFRLAAGDRPLFIVAPVAGYAPDRLLEDANFHRPEGHVLYRVQWAD